MLNFETNYILENNIALLRPLELRDFHHLMNFAINEPDLWQYSLIQAGSPDNLKNYINKALEERKNKSAYAFIVFDKRSNQYAGSTRFYDIQLEQATLQLGYTWYGKKFQGSGINKSCKYLMLQFAFENLNMERVEFRADNENKRSINAMKSIGCVVEGVLRSHLTKTEGGRRDSIILSILKEEWQKTIKQKLERELNYFL